MITRLITLTLLIWAFFNDLVLRGMYFIRAILSMGFSPMKSKQYRTTYKRYGATYFST